VAPVREERCNSRACLKPGRIRCIPVSGFRSLYEAFDRFQRRHKWLAFPLAVRQKYAEDQGGYLASAITYYAFFSVFPLLLVFVSVLGFILRGHAALQARIVQSALAQFPIIGHDLTVNALKGNVLALGLGIAGALWAGMRVFLAAEYAMNQLWNVPMLRRLGFLPSRVRALTLLLALGGGILCSTALGGLSTVGAGYALGWKLGAIVLSVALNFLLFWVAFKLLTIRDVGWRSLRGGAGAAAIAYTGLQLLGGFYVGHVLQGANDTYGTFALVIGLLSWIYLSVHVTLLAAEANVVASRGLWPRSFSDMIEQPPTEADERALRARALVEQRRVDETITVGFGRKPK
jgi:membrane protein